MVDMRNSLGLADNLRGRCGMDLSLPPEGLTSLSAVLLLTRTEPSHSELPMM
jgi:hypothetical protein